jgi:hypothetical protein
VADPDDARAWLDKLDQARADATPGRWVYADDTEWPNGAGFSANVVAPSQWDVACCLPVARASHGGVDPSRSDQRDAARANAAYIEAMHGASPRLTGITRAMLNLADRRAHPHRGDARHDLRGEALTEPTEGPPPANVQTGPYPTALVEMVADCEYREGWTVYLADMVRERAGTHGAESKGLTLVIVTNTVNSYPPHQPMNVHHYFAVPPATSNDESWRWWLFERFLSVERHECMEFFTIGGEKPYAPNHGPGWDPYLVTVVATDVDRRTSFRGEVAPVGEDR